jgi:hypothetical protein
VIERKTDRIGVAGRGSAGIAILISTWVGRSAFSRQLEDFQKSAPDLNKAIQDSAGTIDGITDIEKARAEIDKLRETVSTLLGAVSDDGSISQLGVKAHDEAASRRRVGIIGAPL